MQYIVPMPKSTLSMATIFDKWWTVNEGENWTPTPLD